MLQNFIAQNNSVSVFEQTCFYDEVTVWMNIFNLNRILIAINDG
jgi:hypothetical protein